MVGSETEVKTAPANNHPYPTRPDRIYHVAGAKDAEEGEALGGAGEAGLRAVGEQPGFVGRGDERLLARPRERVRPCGVAQPVADEVL